MEEENKEPFASIDFRVCSDSTAAKKTSAELTEFVTRALADAIKSAGLEGEVSFSLLPSDGSATRRLVFSTGGGGTCCSFMSAEIGGGKISAADEKSAAWVSLVLAPYRATGGILSRGSNPKVALRRAGQPVGERLFLALLELEHMRAFCAAAGEKFDFRIAGVQRQAIQPVALARK